MCSHRQHLLLLFNHPTPPGTYTLSLHDALPIFGAALCGIVYTLDEPTVGLHPKDVGRLLGALRRLRDRGNRSEEHTSELQSLRHLVCRLLLEKKKQKPTVWFSRASTEPRMTQTT